MGLGSKRQLSLPQTEQEGAGALAEAVPDTKVSTCGHTSCGTSSTFVSGCVILHIKLLLCA